MILATYATFEKMHGRKSSVEELVQSLRLFSRDSVLSLCAFIGLLLRLWDADPFDLARYDHLVSCAFDDLRGSWYKLAARLEQEPEFAFHRRQLLLVAKLAVLYSPPVGLDVWKATPGHFGTILLMANDHFHYGLPAGAGSQESDKVKRLFTEFIPVAEGTGSRPEYKLVRSHRMLKFAAQLRDHPLFIDMENEFRRTKGLCIDDYEGLCFGLFAKCAAFSLEDLQRGPSAFTFREENFHATAVRKELIPLFLKDVRGSAIELRAGIRSKDYGTNDFTELRKRPMISVPGGHLPIDILFLVEKFESGPYWTVNDISREMGDRLRKFWGAVFEAYMNDLLRDSLAGSGAILVTDPRRIDDPNVQICDALILEGNSLIMLEYKASMFRAESKYSGDYQRLLTEIEEKLVNGKGKSKKKGVAQLADAVVQMFGEPKKEVVAGIDLTAVTKVYPLLITLDGIGGCLLMSRVLDYYFSELMADREVSDVSIGPLLCCDVQGLEEISGCFRRMSLAQFIEHWLSKDPNFMATLTAHTVPELIGHRNERLAREWKNLSNEISARMFPEEYAAHAASNPPRQASHRTHARQ